jgi:hypothetical protein
MSKYEKTIPITDPKHLIDMGRTHGLLVALDAVEAAAKELKLPGIGVAIHAIKAAEAEQRVMVMQRNIRTAVAAGVDLDTHNILWSGKAEIYADPISASDDDE